ncbi:MAG: hypothetical protein JRJ66_14140 [Deltaproteobacteria bacterium]|nr:hypothetical protein [Deltaproteobacteria bacterium]
MLQAPDAEKKYRVLFLGLLKSRQEFEEGMSKLGVNGSEVKEILQKGTVILKSGMRLKEARQYADAIQLAGGRVRIEEHGFFEEDEQMHKTFEIKPLGQFIACPECGYKQLKGKSCLKCGFVFERESN